MVSVTSGLTTLAPSKSAWNCISRLLREAPPSTLREASRTPASFCIAETISMVWKAIPSSAARAICAAVVPRVMPVMLPFAYWSQ